MKKITRLTALIAGLFMLVFSGCETYLNNVYYTETNTQTAKPSELSIYVTSDSDLVDFSTPAPVDGARTIIPTAYQAGNLWFYLSYKNITNNATSFTTPELVTVEADDSDSQKGKVTINLTAAQYEFKLYAVKKTETEISGNATQPASNPTLPDNAVLMGTASADLRTYHEVNFFLISDGLTGTGEVNLELYPDGWTVPAGYTVSAEMQYTKKTGTNKKGDTVSNSATDASWNLNSATSTNPQTYVKTASPGTYNFIISFTNTKDSKTFEWSDRVVVIPGGKTAARIPIPNVIEQKPTKPATLKAGFIDTDNENSLYYTGAFVWEDSSYNEKYFELQLVEVPSGVDSGYAQPTTDTDWTTLVNTATNASNKGENIIYGVKAQAKNGTDPEYKIFYGQTNNGYVDGSLLRNETFAKLTLTLGMRYIARIRAVNDQGESDWTYATLTEDLTTSQLGGGTAAKKFTSSSINRYKVTYAANGGSFYDVTTGNTTTAPDLIYYYSQEDTAGNPIMDATGKQEFDATKSDKNTTVTKPLLKFGNKKWTNWLSPIGADGKPVSAVNGVQTYNAVGAVPANYKGCSNLNLIANYATIGAITIFDDNKYAIGTIESTPAFPTAMQTDQTALALTIAQDSTTPNIIWKVNYPTGVQYKKVELIIESTTKNSGRYYTVPADTSTAGIATFTIPYKTYESGLYAAKIYAYTNVRPQDPYQKTIILNITQTTISPVLVANTDTITLTKNSSNVISYTSNAGVYTESVTYKWYKNDTEISGATGATYTIPATDTTSATYKLEITGANATATGSVTAQYVTPPVLLAGTEALVPTYASGTGLKADSTGVLTATESLTYAWFYTTTQDAVSGGTQLATTTADIADAQVSTDLTAAGAGTYYFYCTVTGATSGVSITKAATGSFTKS